MKVAVCLLVISIVSDGLAKTEHLQDALNWLKKYGYFELKADKLSNKEIKDVIQEPLKKMQHFYGLKENGKIDKETQEVLDQQRCANSDNEKIRVKRYTLLSDITWWKMPVTISFKNYWQGPISKRTQRRLAIECAKLWSKHSGIKFRLLRTGKVGNIHVEFVRIDGKMNVVGRALSAVPFRRPATSYLKLDKDESWIPRAGKYRRGVPMKWAICHEMGHTLSLGHSNSRDAIMYPHFARPVNGRLGYDDIRGIRRLYGRAH